MKRIYLTLFATLVVITSSAEWKPFINKGGVYTLFNETDIVPSFKPTEEYPKGSIIYYTYCLGYATGEVNLYFANSEGVVALNTFNNEVLFVLPRDENKTSLTQQEVDKMMVSYKPTADDFLLNLKNGLEKESIRQTFVETSLGIKAMNNAIKDDIHGYTYIFNNGVMTEYKSISGFSDDAILVKENFPNTFELFEFNAKKYYAMNSSIIAYINGQCKYLMLTPESYINKAPNSNYALLYCILNEGMSFDEFNTLVPEAEISSNVGNIIIMSYGNYIFTFVDKVLIKD